MVAGRGQSAPTKDWLGYASDPQHTAVSEVAAQHLTRIKWHVPVDLDPQYTGTELLIHYASPLISPGGTVIVTVKTGATGQFKVEGLDAVTGSTKWSIGTDYLLPPHYWTPECASTLVRSGELYTPGAGGTVKKITRVDSNAPKVQNLAFYGIAYYRSAPATYDKAIRINTPISRDGSGDVFFGFRVLASNPLNLQSGIARISRTGKARWLSAAAASGDDTMSEVVMNCAPAFSNDGKVVYFAVSNGRSGYLVGLDSASLKPMCKVMLTDPDSGNDAYLSDDGTASPMIGPDGDVYYGVLENPFYENHLRGWMLHFDKSLVQRGAPGAFGWDDTPSVVPSAIVPSYGGTSGYLILTKYNNYLEGGGDGINKVAVLDPNATEVDPVTGIKIMNEVITVRGVTTDGEPPAVKEWCINSAAVDPISGSALVNSEDGTLYRWDLAKNRLVERIPLTGGLGEAYTPTIIGPAGTVYAISDAQLFAVGE